MSRFSTLQVITQTDSAVSFIGAGNYATSVLIPAFKAAGARLVSIISNKGVSSLHAARKYGFERVESNISELIQSSDTQSVIIATRHNTHAQLVAEALKAGKHVFVEKPLCLTLDELAQIQELYQSLGK